MPWHPNREIWVASEELENRVRERTAELVATNRALNREIGERREVEQALRASEKNYRDLVDSVYRGDTLLLDDGR